MSSVHRRLPRPVLDVYSGRSVVPFEMSLTSGWIRSKANPRIDKKLTSPIDLMRVGTMRVRSFSEKNEKMPVENNRPMGRPFFCFFRTRRKNAETRIVCRRRHQRSFHKN